MKKEFVVNKFKIKINLKKITYIIGSASSGKSYFVSKLNQQYNIPLLNDVFSISLADYNKLTSNNDSKIKDLIKKLNLEKVISDKNFNISLETKALIKLIIFLKENNDIIMIDNVLTYLNHKQQKIIIKYIKDSKITLLNITNDIEEVLWSDYLLILDEGNTVLYDKTTNVLKEENQLKQLGLSLPFIVNLSIQLGLYELIDKIYYNNEDLIGDLWK